MTPRVRIRPESLAENLAAFAEGLKAAREASAAFAERATLAVDTANRCAAACDTANRALTDALREHTRRGAQLLSAMAGSRIEFEGALAELTRHEADFASRAALEFTTTRQALGDVEAVLAARLAAMDARLNEATAAAAHRRETTDQQLDRSSVLFDLLAKQHRTLHAGLVRLGDALGAQEELLRKQRRRARQALARQRTIQGCRALERGEVAAAQAAFAEAWQLDDSPDTRANHVLGLLLTGRRAEALDVLNAADWNPEYRAALGALQAMGAGELTATLAQVASRLQASPPDRLPQPLLLATALARHQRPTPTG